MEKELADLFGKDLGTMLELTKRYGAKQVIAYLSASNLHPINHVTSIVPVKEMKKIRRDIDEHACYYCEEIDDDGDMLPCGNGKCKDHMVWMCFEDIQKTRRMKREGVDRNCK